MFLGFLEYCRHRCYIILGFWTEEIIIKIPAKLEYILKTVIVLDLFSFILAPKPFYLERSRPVSAIFFLGYLKAGVLFASSRESYFLDTQ